MNLVLSWLGAPLVLTEEVTWCIVVGSAPIFISILYPMPNSESIPVGTASGFRYSVYQRSNRMFGQVLSLVLISNEWML